MASKVFKQKILFIKQFSANAKFVTNDVNTLKEKYNVSLYNTYTKNNIKIIFTLLKQFIYLLFNTYKFKLVYIWFADYHSFFPVLLFKIFRKKSIICAGGYEATYIPEINCGVFTNDTIAKSIRRFAVSFSLNNCSYILPVDDSLIYNENSYIHSNQSVKKILKDGIKHFLPNIKAKIRTVAPGYDSEVFKKRTNITKEKMILCAGLVPNDFEIKRKGFDYLIDAAKQMPDTKFVFIGFTNELIEQIEKLNIKNLKLISTVSYDELIENYSSAKVFAQISLFEGFPSTLCEAMLCECIPVGSNVNGIPKIINSNGFIIKNRNLDEVLFALKKAIEAPEELGFKAREHIMKNFTLEKRKESIISIVSEMTN